MIEESRIDLFLYDFVIEKYIKAALEEDIGYDDISTSSLVDFSKDISFEEAVKLAKEHGVKLEKHYTSVGHIINAFFDEKCDPYLQEPTFVYRYPIEVSPLTKKYKDDPRFTERFELFIGGVE